MNIRTIQLTFKAIFIAIMAAVITTSPLQAASLPSLLQNNVQYYIPGDVCGTGGATSGIPDNTTLPDEFVEQVSSLRATYEAAAQETNLPWQVLAGIHYRESNFNTSRDLQAGNPIGGPYPQSSTSYAKFGYPSTFQESVIIAGKELQDKAQAGLFNKRITADNIDVELIKDALFGYNGRAGVYARQAVEYGFDAETQPYEGSPYVMNRFDAARQSMGIITRDFGPMDGRDSRYGAFTIYALLGGPTTGAATTGGDNCTAPVATGSLLQLVQQYAWETYTRPNFYTMKPAYEKAVAAAGDTYVGGGSRPGIDCGGFITLLMRNSGTDPTYNNRSGNVIAQREYMENNPRYQKITDATTTADLQPGDIWINRSGQHTYMYVGPLPEFQHEAVSASIGGSAGNLWRTPMSSPVYDINEPWYRLIN